MESINDKYEYCIKGKITANSIYECKPRKRADVLAAFLV